MPEPPHILFILSDEQRWDSLGCYGQTAAVSPRLDAMAAAGTRFELAFSCSPLCGPARSCLQTGLYPSSSGCTANNRALPPALPTLAGQLAAGGYETAYVGKWHLASDSHEGEDCYWTRAIPPERRGGWRDHWLAVDVPEYCSNGTGGCLFDGDNRQVDFHNRYRADAYTDFALEILRKRRERPLAMMLSLVEPHAQPYHRLYQGPPSERRRHEYREITYEGPDELLGQFADVPLPPDLLACPGQAAEFWPDYLAACAAVDRNVGRLLDALRDEGMLDNTVVLFAADHGCHFFSRLPTVAKCTSHESSIRIPMIACGPGFDGGGSVQSLVSLIDVVPTLLTAAGLPVPDDLPGRTLQGADRDWTRDAVYVELPHPPGAVALRERPWKLVAQGPEFTPIGLYDLASDPAELHNVLAHEPARAATMLATLRRQIPERAAP